MLLALAIAYRICSVVLNDVLDEGIFIEMNLVVEHAHFLKDDFIVFLQISRKFGIFIEYLI